MNGPVEKSARCAVASTFGNGDVAFGERTASRTNNTFYTNLITIIEIRFCGVNLKSRNENHSPHLRSKGVRTKITIDFVECAAANDVNE